VVVVVVVVSGGLKFLPLAALLVDVAALLLRRAFASFANQYLKEQGAVAAFLLTPAPRTGPPAARSRHHAVSAADRRGGALLLGHQWLLQTFVANCRPCLTPFV
jgi:hypothetical protein